MPPFNYQPGLLQLLRRGLPPQSGFNLGGMQPMQPPSPVPPEMLTQNVDMTVRQAQPMPPPQEEGISPGMAALTAALGSFLPTRPIAAGLEGYYGAKQAQQGQRQAQRSAEQQAAQAEAFAQALEKSGNGTAAAAIRAGLPKFSETLAKQSGEQSFESGEAAAKRIAEGRAGATKRLFESEEATKDRAAGIQKANIYAGAMPHPQPRTGIRAKSTQLTTAETNAFRDAGKALELADQIINEVKPEYIGKFTGPINAAMAWAGEAPEGFTEFRAKLTGSMAAYLKALSGLVVSDAEVERLRGMLADASAADSPQQFDGKMKAFKNELQLQIKHGLNAYEANGRDVSSFRKLYGVPSEEQSTSRSQPGRSREEIAAERARLLEELETAE